MLHTPDRPPDSGIHAVVRYGRHSRFHVDTANFIEWCVLFKGQFGDGTATLIGRFLKPGMVAFDVGANNGTETILMSEAVGTEGRVIAVEPAAAARARLVRNLELNCSPNVTIVDRCLGRSPGDHVFLIMSTTANPTASSCVGSKPPRAADTEIVDVGAVSTLDSVTIDLGVSRVDLIKIDTDGNEVDVLAGSVETLQTHHPTVIFEFEPSYYRTHGSAWTDAYDLMTGVGYDLFKVAVGRSAMDAQPLTRTDPGAGDILALWRP
jgi:FkbM family methyltransferase